VYYVEVRRIFTKLEEVLGNSQKRDFVPGVAERLVSAREGKELTQAEAARRAKIAPQNLYHYELGNKTPGLLVLYRFARGYGVPIADLLPPIDEVLGPEATPEPEPEKPKRKGK
jgi:transcriptional regulator with XRE-family HTH domain